MKLKEYLKELSFPRIIPTEDEKRYSIDVLIYSENDTKEIQKILSKTLKRIGRISRLNVMRKL